MNLDDVAAVLPLLQFSITKLRDFAALAEKESHEFPYGNRIKYTSEKLQCTLEDVCKEFEKHKFLFYIPLDRFTTILDMLLGAGISPQYILSDMWALRYNVSNIKRRLDMAKEAQIRTLKPWMLRCSLKVFYNKLQKEVAREKLLGESSVSEYLAQQLQCDAETIEYLGSKHPPILRIHVSKLKEILDFLYREGYTSQHICQVPRILCHSLETTKSRLAQLRELGFNPTSLIVLCKSKREYAQFLEQVIRKKNR
ncbi:transcription termination factor, mitochondrial isoform X2 [Zootermopsis nevadensis]|nr:transcription termination factor, mitochondrial isoform X2 [Zootermopsis nevadensis]